MNFLLFTLEYPPFKGGVANYYKNLVDYWGNGNIYVLANKQDGFVNTDKVEFKKIISRKFLPRWLGGFYFLFKSIKKNKINYVLVGHVLPLGTITYFLSKFLNFKYTVIMHGMDFEFALRNKRKKYLTKKILKNADKVICGNSYLAKLVKEKMQIENIDILNPSVSEDIVKKDSNKIAQIKEKYKLKNKKVLLSVGRLVKRKGFDKVIEIFPEILSKYPDLIYVIIGKGEDANYLKEKAKDFKKNILFFENLNEAEKWAWFFVSDIFVMPSRNIDGDFEGFGIVYLEANLAKLPVIAGNSGGVGDAVVNGLNGLLVDPEDNNEIKNAILKLLEDDIIRKKIGENGYKRVKKDFNSKKDSDIFNINNK